MSLKPKIATFAIQSRHKEVIYEKVDAPVVVLVELADKSVLNLYYGKH